VIHLKEEKRAFTIHGRKYCLTLGELVEKLGTPYKHTIVVWEGGERKEQ